MDINNLLPGMLLGNLGNNATLSELIKMGALYVAYKTVEELLPIVKKEIIEKCTKKKNRIIQSMTEPNSLPTSEIVFSRDYENNNASKNYMFVDSIIDYICGLDSVKKLRYSSLFSFDQFEVFDVTDKIKGKLIEKRYNEDESEKKISFTLFSTELKLTELKAWSQVVFEKYMQNKNNELGDKRYYFDQQLNNQNEIVFNYVQFSTTKSLNNLYGQHIQKVKKRVDKFLYNREWYDRHGIPYTLGLLLSGNPGCGKTSLIKAIAKESNRHVFNLRITDKTFVSELKQLLYTTEIKIMKENRRVETVSVPLDERVYVLEDVDCLTNIVLDRKLQDVLQKSQSQNMSVEEKQNKLAFEKLNSHKYLNLSILLNLLDGILETPGRILILTSNYPEKLDKALIRPGRIDSHIDFTNCSTNDIYQMCRAFYENEGMDEEMFQDFDSKFTPAFIQECILNCETVEEFVEKIGGKSEEKVERTSIEEMDRTSIEEIDAGKKSEDKEPVDKPIEEISIEEIDRTIIEEMDAGKISIENEYLKNMSIKELKKEIDDWEWHCVKEGVDKEKYHEKERLIYDQIQLKRAQISEEKQIQQDGINIGFNKNQDMNMFSSKKTESYKSWKDAY